MQDPLITLIIVDKKLTYLQTRFKPIPRTLKNVEKRMDKFFKETDVIVSDFRKNFPGVLD
jgi:hypothetical protein